ncbi:MAG: hypothetical protein GY866_41310 [Proteobacteria bacterium]|nr:hypothetical protein [Pseudomonadota bacterium]
MVLRKMMKAAMAAALVAGLSTTASAEGTVTASGEISTIFGQYSNSKKVAARESDGQAATDSKEEASKLTRVQEAAIKLRYQTDTLDAKVSLGRRTDDPWGKESVVPGTPDKTHTPYGNVTWSVTDSLKLKFGGIVPEEMSLWMNGAGSSTYATVSLGAFSGLAAYVDDPGIQVQYWLTPTLRVGGALFINEALAEGDVYNDLVPTFAGKYDENTGKWGGYVDARVGACQGVSDYLANLYGASPIAGNVATCEAAYTTALQTDRQAIMDAHSEGEGMAYQVGVYGGVLPNLYIGAGYLVSIADQSDGGPTDESNALNLMISFYLSPTMNFQFGMNQTLRTAFTGVNPFESIDVATPAAKTALVTGLDAVTTAGVYQIWAGADADPTGKNMDAEYTKNEMALHASIGVGIGTVKATVGMTTIELNLFGSKVDSESSEIQDIDLVFQMPLTEDKKSGFEVMMLTKETKPDAGDTVKKQFVGAGVYTVF